MSVARARETLLSQLSPVVECEEVELHEATGRVLSSDVTAGFDVPASDNSAMDGFALKGVDLPSAGVAAFDLIGEAWAGQPFAGELPTGAAVKIATGAVMPAGSDTVVIQERVRLDGETLLVSAGERAGANVRLAGEDVRKGEVALTAGTRVHALEAGRLASLGVRRVAVRRRVRVAFFSTGDELVSLASGAPLGPGAVYDSNRYSLRSALSSLAVDLHDLGIVADTAAATESALETASRRADLVIATGGASISEADHVAATLRARGDLSFWRVAMRPGRPLASGTIGGARFFGLPGNPVAALVSYYQFVLPALKRLMGCTALYPPHFRVRCGSILKKSLGRVEFQRGVWSLSDGEPVVHSTGRQGAGRLSSMVRANCFIVLHPEQSQIEPGEWVDVQPFEALF